MKNNKLFNFVGIVVATMVLIIGCDKLEHSIYGSDNPDPNPTGSNPATITDITPSEGYLKDIVTINGSGFSATPEDNLVSFGQMVGTVMSASHSSLQVETPTLTGQTVEVKVAIKGSEFWSNSGEFTFKDAVGYVTTDINWPMGVDADEDGNVYVGSAGDGVIYKFDPNGEMDVFAEVEPSGAIRFGPENWLYVCQSWEGTVTRVSPDGSTIEEFAVVDAALDIDWDASGNTYVLQSWGGGIIRIDPSGNQTVVVEEGVYGGEIKSCRIFGDYIYFTEIWGSTIWRMDISASGLENPVAVYEGDSPVGIEIDENGTVYFSEAWETTLYTLNPDDMSVGSLFEEELMTPMRYLNFVHKILYIVYPGWGDIGEVMSVFIGIPQAPGPDYTSG
jgi:sugar lactone lactonase YvrE